METCPRCRQFKIMCMCSSGDDEKSERERQRKQIHQLEQLKHQQYVLSNASSRCATPNVSAIKNADSGRTKVKPLEETSQCSHAPQNAHCDGKSSDAKSPNKVSLNQHLQKQQINAKLLQNGEVVSIFLVKYIMEFAMLQFSIAYLNHVQTARKEMVVWFNSRVLYYNLKSQTFVENLDRMLKNPGD